MSKDDSLALKGVAILMMILYHLFYVSHGGEYSSELFLGGVRLLERFSEICYPVSLYMILSGYGLYASYESSNKSRNYARISKLYLHLWLIYLVMIPLAILVKPERYPGSWHEFFLNFFSLKSSYNIEQWFLLPYILIMLLSNNIFKLIDKINVTVVLLFAIASWFVYCFVWIKFNSVIPYAGIVILYVISFMLPFSLGALARKFKWIKQFKLKLQGLKIQKHLQIYLFIFFSTLIIFRMLIHNQSLQPFISLILVFVWALAKIPTIIKSVLKYLGLHSLNVWLIHTWFCYYLFGDIIYGLQKPWMIFLVTLLPSLLISHLVEYLYCLLCKIHLKKLS